VSLDGLVLRGQRRREVDVSETTVLHRRTTTTLYARWIASVGIVYYEGNALVAEYPVKTGRPVGTLPAPRIAKENQMFLGWYTADSGGSLVTEETTFSSDAKLYARWSPYVTVTFNAGQGSSAVSELRLPTSGTQTIADYPVPTATGYNFEGWYYPDAAGKEIDVGTATVYTADTTLYARWSRNTNTTDLRVTQAGCAEDETLPDPIITLPELPVDEEWAGATAISYAGTGTTSYMSTSKPTEPGSYKVIAQRNTFETAYVGSAEFTITSNGVTRYHVNVADGIVNGTVSSARPPPRRARPSP
jgi:uncharacterized repeat protein (TIGR02543 family)